jgi:Rod binding domain-containing protein
MDPIKNHKTGFLPLDAEKPLTVQRGSLPQLDKKEAVARDFERIFALQLVSEMTKGTFKTADNAIGKAGSEIYRSQINETLAAELARNGSLGIARMLISAWKIEEEKQP